MSSRTELATDLHSAVAAHQLDVAYQPIFDLSEPGIPRTPVAVEALCRWRHPVRGVVMPDEFIPIAEEERLIEAIDAEMLRMAGGQVREWQRAGYSIALAVNASPTTLTADFVTALGRRARELNLQDGTLIVEITETPPPQLAPSVLDLLPTLRAIGVGVSIDDFGAGDTTASMLDALSIDEVKIDRSLTQRDDDEAGQAIAEVVRRSATHGWLVVAEGIETEEDLERARSRGCDRGQGYLLGRPGTAQAVETLLIEARGR